MSDRGQDPRGAPPARETASRNALDQARNFLSSLFMGLRTAQMHDPANKAFENAIQAILRSADSLYATTGGFSIQFVEESAYLNGTRIRFEGGAFATMRTLRDILESQGMGGVEMRSPPSHDAMRKLILLFASDADGSISKEDLGALNIGVLGIQRFADESRSVNVDRKVFAVQCYGKLILALREQFERVRKSRESPEASSGRPPRLRAVRVIQDLIELCSDRADFLLRLSSNTQGAPPAELHGVNVCILSLVMGHCLGFRRENLVDIGVASLFHHIGLHHPGDVSFTPEDAHASLSRLLAESGVSRSSFTRSFIVAEHNDFAFVRSARTGRKPHFFSRLVNTAIAYNQLISGFGTSDGQAFSPIDSLRLLDNDKSGCFDPRMIDLLINVLRAFPADSEVVLDDGRTATVITNERSSRWDRPMVRINSDPPQNIDLMAQGGGRFAGRILGTKLFLGQSKFTEPTYEEDQEPPPEKEEPPTSSPSHPESSVDPRDSSPSVTPVHDSSPSVTPVRESSSPSVTPVRESSPSVTPVRESSSPSVTPARTASVEPDPIEKEPLARVDSHTVPEMNAIDEEDLKPTQERSVTVPGGIPFIEDDGLEDAGPTPEAAPAFDPFTTQDDPVLEVRQSTLIDAGPTPEQTFAPLESPTIADDEMAYFPELEDAGPTPKAAPAFQHVPFDADEDDIDTGSFADQTDKTPAIRRPSIPRSETVIDTNGPSSMNDTLDQTVPSDYVAPPRPASSKKVRPVTRPPTRSSSVRPATRPPPRASDSVRIRETPPPPRRRRPSVSQPPEETVPQPTADEVVDEAPTDDVPKE